MDMPLDLVRFEELGERSTIFLLLRRGFDGFRHRHCLLVWSLGSRLMLRILVVVDEIVLVVTRH